MIVFYKGRTGTHAVNGISHLHSQHTFRHRSYRNGKWKGSTRTVAQVLPDGFINNLENREITDEDYETLLLLDSGPVQQASIPLHIVNSFPVFKLSAITNKPNLFRDGKCGICACFVTVGEMIRTIPCGHAFHQTCIDRWLLRQRTTCPTCGLASYTAIGNDEEEDDTEICEEEAKYTAKHYNIPKKIKKKPKKDTLAKTVTNDAIEIIGLGSFAGPSTGTTLRQGIETQRRSRLLPERSSLAITSSLNQSRTASGTSIPRITTRDDITLSIGGTTDSPLSEFKSSPLPPRRKSHSCRLQPKKQDSSVDLSLDALMMVSRLG